MIAEGNKAVAVKEARINGRAYQKNQSSEQCHAGGDASGNHKTTFEVKAFRPLNEVPISKAHFHTIYSISGCKSARRVRRKVLPVHIGSLQEKLISEIEEGFGRKTRR